MTSIGPGGGQGNDTVMERAPVHVHVRVPAWMARVHWWLLVAVITTGMVAWGAQALLTQVTVRAGTPGLRVALATLWLAGMMIGYLLPPPPLAIPPPPARARDISEQEGETDTRLAAYLDAYERLHPGPHTLKVEAALDYLRGRSHRGRGGEP